MGEDIGNKVESQAELGEGTEKSLSPESNLNIDSRSSNDIEDQYGGYIMDLYNTYDLLEDSDSSVLSSHISSVLSNILGDETLDIKSYTYLQHLSPQDVINDLNVYKFVTNKELEKSQVNKKYKAKLKELPSSAGPRPKNSFEYKDDGEELSELLKFLDENGFNKYSENNEFISSDGEVKLTFTPSESIGKIDDLIEITESPTGRHFVNHISFMETYLKNQYK